VHRKHIDPTFEQAFFFSSAGHGHFWRIPMASKRRPSTYTMNPTAFERELIRRGSTSTDIVRKTGLDRRVVAKAEKGLPVSMQTIKEIAKFFNIELAELGVKKFTGDNESNASKPVAKEKPSDSTQTIESPEDEYRSWLTQEEGAEEEDFYITGMDASDEFVDPNPLEMRIEFTKRFRSNGELKVLVKLKMRTESWVSSNSVDAAALADLLQFQIKNDIIKRFVKRSNNKISHANLAFLKFMPFLMLEQKRFVLQTEMTRQQSIILYTWAGRVGTFRTKHLNKSSLYSFSATESGMIEFTNWVSNSDRAFGYPYVA
jgi:transcriptional regulator with XRE-family HTH domain